MAHRGSLYVGCGVIPAVSDSDRRADWGVKVITVFHHDDCLLHDTGGFHPEKPERLVVCRRALQASDLLLDWQTSAHPVTDETLCRVHTAAHVSAVKAAVARAPAYLDPDTPVSSGSLTAATRAIGLTLEATRQVARGAAKLAICLVRPPGHHATSERAMGFCLFNNIAFAAKWCLEEGSLSRVLIVDFDVHHGNGTQEIFYYDDYVMFFSIHRYPFYPGTGSSSEIGAGRGQGFTRNVPVQFGTSRSDYLAMFREHLEDVAEIIQPEIVLVSAGFDAHRADPIGNLGLETEDFERIGKEIAAIARRYCNGKVVSLLEGGYNLDVLGESLVAYLRGLTMGA